MEEPKNGTGINLLNLFLVIVAFIAVTAYGTIALAAQDAVWFLKGFDQPPDRVIVYHDGQKDEFGQGDPQYEQLAEAVRLSLDAGVARQSGIGMGEVTLEEAYTKYVTVEAFFYSPAKLHAWFNTFEPTRMLFPITGRHSELSVVFMGIEGKYMSNGPVLKDMSPLRTALDELGYLND
jgi:hypothetical protein